MTSFAERIAQLAADDATSPVVRVVAVDGTETVVTWPELHRRSTQIARALQERGTTEGARVAVALRNSPEFVMTVLATWKLGAVPVPVRWDLPDWERERVLEVIDGVSVGVGDLAWLESTHDLDPTPLTPAVSPMTNGICSSGSTGSPKVILMDKPGIFDDMTGMPFASTWAPVARPQIVLVMAPMYHTNGFATLFSLLAGDHLVVLQKFDAARIVDLVEAHGISTFTATTLMLQRIADLPDIEARDLSSLVWFLQGAAVISPSLVRRWIDLVGAEKVYQSYGMTEGIGLCAIRGDEWLAHPGSVGRGFRGTEIKILDEDGNQLPDGEVGEIYMRSPSSGMFHYIGGAPLPPRTVDDFSTGGDLGWLEPEGYLHIVDRRVDMIITGGANVFPAEVETALIDHPQIADVVVVGLKDDEWGRRVHAIIEAADRDHPPTDDDVRAFAKERLAAYKVPKSVEFVDVIPRTEATKVSRAALIDARGG
ncbi:MAG TPA: AMP-binding protein [Acidimicrobiia bacterium]